jgi:predicted dehydrogenase
VSHNVKDGRVLRGALIGFGNAALHAHLPAWHHIEQFRIDAVVEPDPERARLARELIPGASVYADIEPALAPGDLDFVDICTPSYSHAGLVEKALSAGLHVLCEKPLVTSFESLKRIEAARPSGCVLFTVNNWKHAPLWVKTQELLSEKGLGSIESISLAVLRPPNSGGGVLDWRRRAETAGGGILLDHGWHQLYLIRSVVTEAPLYVSAKMDYAGKIEETVDLSIRFHVGEARLHLTWRAPSRQNRGEIAGKNGRILINDDHLVALTGGSPEARHDFPEPLSGGSHHPAWMGKVVENFRREIIDETIRGANLAEARWCARLIHCAYQSSREGSRDVRVDDLAI